MTIQHKHANLPAPVRASIDRPPLIRTRTVVVVDFRRGEGCCDADPVRMATALYGLEGALLAVHDPLTDGDYDEDGA